MYIPKAQEFLAAGLAAASVFIKPGDSISKGEVMDYAVEKCIDADGNKRCSTPFLVKSDVCYQLEWRTDGALSHTTVEVRDAGSDEVVYYRDTNGEWTPEKGELVYLDFKPKVWKTGNDTVQYEVKTCKK